MRQTGLLIFFLCFLSFFAIAQNNRTVSTQETPFIQVGLFSAQELEQQRLEAIKAIELTTQLLNETNAFAKNSLNRLNLLAQQLLSRRKVIAILGQEINEIDRNIKKMTDDIEVLNKDLEKTKENYAKSMQNQQKEYRTAQYKLLLIMSAENLSQTYRRMRYLREYAVWQKEEAERIAGKQTELLHRKEELEKTRAEKQELLAQRESENRKLVDEEKQQQKEVRELNSKQKDLQRLLEQKRKEANALNREIDRLIVEDIKNSEKNRQAAEAEAKSAETASTVVKPSETKTAETASTVVIPPETKTSETVTTETKTTEIASAEASSTTAATPVTASKAPTNNNYVLLGSEVVISKEFESNKGKLPFPLTGKYTIVSTFGEHQHQELSYVRTNNNGIDIQTTADAEARAIFRGVVTRVFVMPGFNNNVIIRHGDFLSVYSNLSQVYIKAGDVVSSNQIIGKIFTDTAKGNETILHFQIWKERTKLNPAQWIR